MAKAKEDATKKPVKKPAETIAKTPKTTKEAVVKAVDKKEINITPETVEKNSHEIPLAKAGKKSAKAVKETQEKQAKEIRKAESKDTDKPVETKPTAKPARSRIERAGKNYRKVAQLVDRSKTYSLADALDLAIKTNPVKFDASVELHINLGVDPKQADQNIRDIVVLPAGTGKSIKIAVFADGDAVKQALDAGADIAGGDEFLQKLDKGLIDFDVLISMPTMMPKLGKYAKLLGPKGLMPNPKSGTVTMDVAKAVVEAKAGRVEYRVDSSGIIHVAVGKVSFGSDKLQKNTQAVLSSVRAAKPASLKGIYMKSAYISTSMGPSIKTEINI
jgi:large subunit ribosomal protein L1